MNQKLGLSTFSFGEVVILFESGVEGREREGKQERVLEIRVLEGTRLWGGRLCWEVVTRLSITSPPTPK